MIFSYRPGDLDVYDGGTGKSLGNCRGWRPPGVSCEAGFATDDVFFLEACLFSFVCRNRDELFSISVGSVFHCDFDGDAFDELQLLIQEEPAQTLR